MRVRHATESDEDAVVALRGALWPDEPPDERRATVRAILAGRPPSTMPLTIFVAERDGELVGFAEVGLRSHADGCDPIRPAGYLEGWYVRPDAARRGVGRELLERGERWARELGATAFGSDAHTDNESSMRAHEALGFELVDRCATFRKSIAASTEDIEIYGRDLALIHHQHFGHVAAAASDELLTRLGSRSDSGRRGPVVDLAAGSGILARRAIDAGFDVVGVDCSPGMLAIAREHAPEATWHETSLWEFEPPRGCAAITATGEAFCYASATSRPNLSTLQHRIATLRSALAPGGLLLFDVAGPGRSGSAGSRERSWSLDCAAIRLTETEAEDGIEREIETFVALGTLYRRKREVHRLTLFEPDAVLAALDRSGLPGERIHAYGSFPFAAGWHGFVARRPH